VSPPGAAPIALVIFGCDGVLVDTERIAVRIDVRVLAELGWTMTEAEVIERFMGRSDELGLTGLYERFAGRIFSASEVVRGKPAPDLLLHAARRMAVAPAGCAVVEDSRYGVEAARAAGMRAFGYAGGLSPRRSLEGPQTVVFDHMRELPQLLASASDR
jgi:beta-phosphoglucomutase-like phosphatase (HAD superfamily)